VSVYSVTHLYCVKMAKHRITQTTPSIAQGFYFGTNGQESSTTLCLEEVCQEVVPVGCQIQSTVFVRVCQNVALGTKSIIYDCHVQNSTCL